MRRWRYSESDPGARDAALSRRMRRSASSRASSSAIRTRPMPRGCACSTSPRPMTAGARSSWTARRSTPRVAARSVTAEPWKGRVAAWRSRTRSARAMRSSTWARSPASWGLARRSALGSMPSGAGAPRATTPAPTSCTVRCAMSWASRPSRRARTSRRRGCASIFPRARPPRPRHCARSSGS